jgi:hypothetical protein
MRKTKSTLRWAVERLTIQPSPDALGKSTKHKLAALKENPEYAKFYAEIKRELATYPVQRVSQEIQDPLDKQHTALQRVFEEFKQSSPLFLRHCAVLDFEIEHLRVLLMARRISSEEVLDLLDPKKDLKYLYSSYSDGRASKIEKSILPKLFLGTPAVRNYALTGPVARSLGLQEGGRPHGTPQPYKVYLVDLRKGETQILREFRRHIKRQCESMKNASAQPAGADSHFKKDDRGRPPKARQRALTVYQNYLELKRRLEDFAFRNKKSERHKKGKLFEAEYPDLSEYAKEAACHRSAKEMAKAIVRMKYRIKTRTLLTMLKEAERMLDK